MFLSIGALPVTGVLYDPVDRIPFVYASPNCVGNETSLLDCPSTRQQQLGQTGFYQDQNNGLENNVVAVRCGGEEGKEYYSGGGGGGWGGKEDKVGSSSIMQVKA